MDAYRPAAPPDPAPAGSPLRDTIARVEEGYPFETFPALAERLCVSQARLGAALDISRSTLSRRRGGRFTVAESGRLYRLERLVESAERTVGDPEDARRWLTSPNPTLGEAPLELARTAPGLEAVERYLEQIADGVHV